MDTNIATALNALYQRQITSREQLLNEMLRVKMTLHQMKEKSNIKLDKEQLFLLMKKTTEDELGFFPADRADFLYFFDALKDIDIIDFTLAIYKNDRMGIIISPPYLSKYICERIGQFQPKRILITEAEKHLSGLQDIVNRFSHSKITLTTQHRLMYILMQQVFGRMSNIEIRFESIYTDCLTNEKFDYIYSLPTFGNRPDESSREFLTKDSDGIALENMLDHLSDNGILDIILPAKITFAGMGYEKLRAYINNQFSVSNIFILPEGTFKPTTAIRTYLLSISKYKNDEVGIGILQSGKKMLDEKTVKYIPMKDFLGQEDWRIELLLADDSEIIQKFKNSNLQKVKLKDVSEVFRGKSILKKDISVGNISVLNISNIEDGEIDYRDMDTIAEEERKIKRYQLLSGDVVLSCRGTAIKSAVFEEQDNIIIASANLIVVRPQESIQGEYIKIFFESPIGLALIKSFQRGTTVMNINYTDIMRMEIPFVPMEKQEIIIRKYNQEHKIYKESIKIAEERWANTKKDVYNELT